MALARSAAPRRRVLASVEDGMSRRAGATSTRIDPRRRPRRSWHWSTRRRTARWPRSLRICKGGTGGWLPAAATGRPAATAGLVRGPAGVGARAPRRHRRDRCCGQEGQTLQPGSKGSARPGTGAARPSATDDSRRDPRARPADRTDGPRRAAARCRLPRPCRAGSRTDAAAELQRRRGPTAAPRSATVRAVIEASGTEHRFLPPSQLGIAGIG